MDNIHKSTEFWRDRKLYMKKKNPVYVRRAEHESGIVFYYECIYTRADSWCMSILYDYILRSSGILRNRKKKKKK